MKIEIDEKTTELIELNKKLKDVSSLLEFLVNERAKTYGYYSKNEGLNRYISKLDSLKFNLKHHLVMIANEEE